MIEDLNPRYQGKQEARWQLACSEVLSAREMAMRKDNMTFTELYRLWCACDMTCCIPALPLTLTDCSMIRREQAIDTAADAYKK